MGCSSSKPRDLSGPVDLSHFTIQRVIGEGGFGKVKAVEKHNKDGTQEWFAMKVLNKESILDSGRVTEVFRERDLLALLHHERICNSYYAFQDRDHLYLVMDIALGGDLRYQLNHKADGKPFTESQSRFYFTQAAAGLAYLHSLDILHRDVKPDNLIMDENGHVMLTDFGISRKLKDGVCKSTSGTSGYIAPEMYKKGHEHGIAADYYALGVCLCEFLFKSKPTVSKRYHATLPNEMVGQTPVSKQAKKTLMKLLERKPEHRLGYNGVEEVKSDPWFATTDEYDWALVANERSPAPFIPDSNKMNAEPTADIQEILLGADMEASLRHIKPEEQKLFEGYNYEFERVVPKLTRGSSAVAARHRFMSIDPVGDAGKEEIRLRNLLGNVSKAKLELTNAGGESDDEDRMNSANSSETDVVVISEKSDIDLSPADEHIEKADAATDVDDVKAVLAGERKVSAENSNDNVKNGKPDEIKAETGAAVQQTSISPDIESTSKGEKVEVPTKQEEGETKSKKKKSKKNSKTSSKKLSTKKKASLSPATPTGVGAGFESES